MELRAFPVHPFFCQMVEHLLLPTLKLRHERMATMNGGQSASAGEMQKADQRSKMDM